MTMNKAKIIAELEDMVVARLFGPEPWPADRETCSALHWKLVQMGLVECVCAETDTWRSSSLGKELDVDLFEVFLGVFEEWDARMILEHYGLIDESEFDAICECTSEDNAKHLMSGYVRRAYFDHRKANKFLH
jgi:hypothetical protein